MKKLYYRFLLWKYRRNAKYYDNITGGQSDFYLEKIREIEIKYIEELLKPLGVSLKDKNNEYKFIMDILNELEDKWV